MAKCYKCMPNWSCDEENKLCEPKQTNADRIRAMSDEELADVVVCPHTGNWDLCRDDCKKCRLEWLKQPAEVQ
jgi:lauroyl/myristoyl acyltransferase